MLPKINDKAWCIFCFLITLWLFYVPCSAENSSVDNQFAFQAESFDYATPISWGFRVHDEEDDTIGLTSDQQTDFSTYPEHW